MKGERKEGARTYLVHGLSVPSTKRLLSAYFTKRSVDALTPEQVFSLAIPVIFDLRNVLSCSLLKIEDPRAWYPGGLVIQASPHALYAASEVDAYIPMEKTIYDQEKFRALFRHSNPIPEYIIDKYWDEAKAFVKRGLRARGSRAKVPYERIDAEVRSRANLEETWAFGPKNSVGGGQSFAEVRRGDSNEVAPFIRTVSGSIDPHRNKQFNTNIKIIGFWTLNGGKYSYNPDEYRTGGTEKYGRIIKSWARETGLPFYTFSAKHRP